MIRKNNNNPNNLLNVQNEVNTSVRNNFVIDKYLGKGKYYDIYQGVNGNKKYIIKVIDKNDAHNTDLIITELGFLKLLNKYQTSKKYINPCYDFGISNNSIFAIFLDREGNNLRKIMETIRNDIQNINDKYSIIKIIIKNLLMGLQYIHKRGVSHQNINKDNIIFKFNDTNGDMKVELYFINFGMSCGNHINLKGNDVLHLTCSKLSNIVNNNNNNNNNNNVTSSDIVKYIKKLPKSINSRSQYLHLSKKKDVYDLGKVFFQLMKTISGHTKKDLVGQPLIKKLYKFITDHMLTDIEKRQDIRGLLQQFILSEKYGWQD